MCFITGKLAHIGSNELAVWFNTLVLGMQGVIGIKLKIVAFTVCMKSAVGELRVLSLR